MKKVNKMLKNLQVSVFILCAINLVQNSFGETPVRNCPNGEVKPLWVQVNSCTEIPCKLWRGFATNMQIQFVAHKNNLNTIKADITMTTFGLTRPYEFNAARTDVCKNLMYEAYCPMYDGEDATYLLVLDIPVHQPDVPAKLQVSIRDTSEANSILACFILDARITDPRTQMLKNNLRIS